MNKLRETQITAVSSSFYKNVSLLTQIVSPSFEFQRHFKKGMFDKPNTAGFLHVSHYLSTVYDANLFKRMVRWPILCKRDEATYRVEMKNFLCLLSQNNSDLNFPSILMSHLIQSGGTKFQIIMWKLSQLALRAYIKREFQEELFNAPCTSPVQDLTIIYFNNVIAQKCNVVTRTRQEMKEILKAANNFLNDEIEILNTYKSEIFDKRENIKRLILDLPAHPLIQERLTNVEDSNIIDLWKRSIFKKVQYIHKKNKELNELEESFDRLCKLVLRISSNSGTLDASKFPEICYDNLLHTQSGIQPLIRNLYANGSIVFSTLLSLLYLAFTQIYRENIAALLDLSQCLPFVQNTCKRMKSLRTLFNTLNTKIDEICRSKQCAITQRIKNAHVDFDTSNVSIANRSILLQSPKIIINLNRNTDDELFYEKLCSSPIEGKHKRLFKRYKREYRPLRELPAILLDDNSWNSINGWLSPRAYSVKSEQNISFKGKPLSPLYSRLLNRSKLILRSKERVSCSPSANYEGLNLTPRKRPRKTEYLTTNACGNRMRELF